MVEPLRYLISVDDLEREHCDAIFDHATYYLENLGKVEWDVLRRKRMLTIFAEPSTRTRMSFEAAMLELGGQVISAQDAMVSSSFAKEEKIKDAFRVMSAYGHIIVFRYNDTEKDREKGVMKLAVKGALVPVVNAGDGPYEHPTQTLVDLFTIQHEKGRIDNLTIGMAGDLYYGRTVHSDVKALARLCHNNRMIFISPSQVALPGKLKEMLVSQGVQFEEYASFREAPLRDIDCLYVTRLQKERFDDLREFEAVKGCCVLTSEYAERMNDDAIILHPLPRVDELPESIDSNKRARYFEQAAYGFPLRMGLIRHILLGW